DFAEAQARIDESLDLIQAAWAHDEPFSWAGRHWQVRDVYLWPRPLQQPHMPMARPCGSPDSWEATGRRGHWALASQYQTAARLQEGWAYYERGARPAGPARVPLRLGRRLGRSGAGHGAELDERLAGLPADAAAGAGEPGAAEAG